MYKYFSYVHTYIKICKYFYGYILGCNEDTHTTSTNNTENAIGEKVLFKGKFFLFSRTKYNTEENFTYVKTFLREGRVYVF